MGPFLEKERLSFYFFPGRSSHRNRVVGAVSDTLRGERLRVCISRPRMSRLGGPRDAGPAWPVLQGAVGGLGAGTASGSEHVCVLRIDLPGDAESWGVDLLRGHLSSPDTTDPVSTVGDDR